MPERDNRYRLVFWALVLIGTGWVVLVESSAWMDHHGDDGVAFGLAFGTMFGHATVAAAWVTFGPGPLIYRLPFSLLWCLALIMAICLPLLAEPGGSPVVFVGGMLGSLWLVLQLPYWGLALWFRLRLRSSNAPELLVGRKVERGHGETQFGIRQLMILTSVVAVMLGLLRVVMPTDEVFFQVDTQLIWIVGLLILSQVILSVPLAVSICLPRHARNGVLISLLLVAVLTPFETQVFANMTAPGPGLLGFAMQNAVSFIWVLLFGVIARSSGYRLLARGVNKRQGAAA